MKTRVLIIVGIVIAASGLSVSAYVLSVQNQCESLLGNTHYPRPLTFWNCLDYLNATVEHNELNCPENHIVYQNNCVGVASENMIIFDASMFFKSVDGKITELCTIDFEEVPEVETCQETKYYTIENNEIKFYIPSNYSQPYAGRTTDIELQCAEHGGKWDSVHITCDDISESSCNIMIGQFQECKTPEYRCPHHDPECWVTAMCFTSCIFDESIKAGDKK